MQLPLIWRGLPRRGCNSGLQILELLNIGSRDLTNLGLQVELLKIGFKVVVLGFKVELLKIGFGVSRVLVELLKNRVSGFRV